MPEGLGNLIGDKFKQAKVQTETQGLNPGTSSSLFVFADYSIRVNVTRVLVESRSITGAMIWGLDTWGSPTTWGGSKGSYSTVEDITLSQTIPTIAREEIAKWLAAESADDPDYGALGTGNTDISAHYLLNDNSLSTTVIDSKGLYNGVSNANTSTMTVSGQINNALEFNGTTDFITISANEPISQTEGTIALWVKFNAIGKDQIIFISGESAADGETGSEDELFIKLNGATDKIEAGWRTANELDIAVSNDAVSTGSFIHVMLRWSLSENQVRLFIANVEQDTGDVFTNDNKDNWVDEMRIGRSMGSAANNNYLDGVLDDIRIYPTALSVTERGEVYNSGSGTETGGLGDPAPYTDGDTALENEIARKTFTTDISTSKRIEYVLEILSTDSSFHGSVFREVGLFNAASVGDLFTRAIISSLVMNNDNDYKVTIRHDLSNLSLGTALVTDDGLNGVRSWLDTGTTTAPNNIAWGTGTTVPAASDTTLEGEIERNAVTGVSRNASVVSNESILTKSEGNGSTITKSGLFDAAASGTLFAESLFGGINKTSLFQIFETDRLKIV